MRSITYAVRNSHVNFRMVSNFTSYITAISLQLLTKRTGFASYILLLRYTLFAAFNDNNMLFG